MGAEWLALVGCAGIVFGAWAISKAWSIEARGWERIRVHTGQLRLVREATVLTQYGARDEAQQLLVEAIEIGEAVLKSEGKL